MNFFLTISILSFYSHSLSAQNNARNADVKIGVMSPGKPNGITDVAGVKVGHINN